MALPIGWGGSIRRGLIVPEGVSHYGLAEHRERLA